MVGEINLKDDFVFREQVSNVSNEIYRVVYSRYILRGVLEKDAKSYALAHEDVCLLDAIVNAFDSEADRTKYMDALKTILKEIEVDFK